MALIDAAARPAELDEVRWLLRAFVAWHRDRHVEDIDLIERYFDQRAFDDELAGLPGKYARPHGRLLLSHVDGKPAGCVALRDLGGDLCEMKRMFVPEAFRGHASGARLPNGSSPRPERRAIAPCVLTSADARTRPCGSRKAAGSGASRRTTTWPRT